MEVSKDDGYREEDEIARIAEEKAHKLYNLGEGKHENELSQNSIFAMLKIPVCGCPPARNQQKRVDGKCQRGEGRNVQSVGAPPLLPGLEVSLTLH